MTEKEQQQQPKQTNLRSDLEKLKRTKMTTMTKLDQQKGSCDDVLQLSIKAAQIPLADDAWDTHKLETGAPPSHLL